MAELQSPGTAYYGYYFGAVLTSTGQPVISSNVNIYDSDGSTNAAVYPVSALTGGPNNVVPLAANFTGGTTNIIATDAYGNLEFYAWPGQYVLAFSVAGVATTMPITVTPWFADAVLNTVVDSSGTITPASGDYRLPFASGANIAYTLPAPALGTRIRFLRTDASTSFTVSIAPPSGASIFTSPGAAYTSTSPYYLLSEGSSLEVVGVGANYYSYNVPPGVLPAGRVAFNSSSIAASIPTATWSLVTNMSGTATYTKGGITWTGGGTSLFTVPVAGLYSFKGATRWLGNTSYNQWGCGAWINGSFYNGVNSFTGIPTNGSSVLYTDDIVLAAGATVGLAAYQTTGSTGSPDDTNPSYTYLAVRLVSY